MSWDDDEVTYPALVDPSWVTSGTMVEDRTGHVLERLQDGRVLVVGKSVYMGGHQYVVSEIFDPATETWAASAADLAASGTRMNLLPDGRVYVSGGIVQDTTYDYDYYTVDSRIYVPQLGTFVQASTVNRAGHVAQTLADGRILIAGGQYSDASGQYSLDQTEVFDPQTNNWVGAGLMNHPGASRSVLLPDGSVLVPSHPQFAERWDPTTSTWSVISAAPGWPQEAGGQVLGMGNIGGTIGVWSYSWPSDTWSLVSSLTPTFRNALPDGRIFSVTGGGCSGSAMPGVYDPSTHTYDPLPPFQLPRCGGIATNSEVLLDGRVLVADNGTSELLNVGPGPVGATCLAPTDCLSGSCVGGICAGTVGDACVSAPGCSTGFCVDGHCCDTACTEGCMGCSAQLTGTTDGTCAPVGAGTLCRPATDDCDVSEVCDGASSACPPDLAAATGTPCGPQNVDCHFNDSCDGNGSCIDAGPWPAGMACGSNVATECNNPDSCDGSGSCLQNNAPVGTPCGDQGVLCQQNDACNGVGFCADYGPSPITSVCRPATDACDVAENCDGAGNCPSDALAASGASGDPSCVPYVCDGTNASCPTSCTGDTDCDPSHFCDAGICVSKAVLGAGCTGGAMCLSSFCVDGVCCDAGCGAGDATDCEACVLSLTGVADGTCAPIVSGTECRAAVGDCDQAEQCDGSTAACPSDALHPAGTICRASAGDCDAPELCDGAGSQCPADVDEPDGATCDDGDSCTVGDVCQAGVCQPGNDGCGGSGGAVTGAGGTATGQGGGPGGGSTPSGGSSPSSQDGGCSVGAVGTPSRGVGWPVLLGLIAVGTGRHRRRQLRDRAH